MAQVEMRAINRPWLEYTFSREKLFFILYICLPLILSKIAREIQKMSNTSEEQAMTYYSDDELHRKPQRNKRIMHLYVDKSIIVSCISAITW